MDEPLISVIIPVYNMELYLERCLDSVLNNTYRNLEVICIDDGSKDSSLEILRRYESVDPRVVVIAKENGGVSSARNAGLNRMTGEFVTFIDSDDFVHPQYLEALYFAISSTNADMAICELTRVSENDLPVETELISVSSIRAQAVTKTQVFRNRELRSYCASKLVKRSVVGSHRFLTDLRISEDIAFFACLWESYPSMQCVTFYGSIYFYYIGNPNSAVANADEREMLKATKYFVERCTLSRENEQIYLYMSLSQGLWHRFYGSEIKGDKTIRKVCDPLLRRCWRMMIVSPDLSAREKISFTVQIFLEPLYLRRRRRDPEYRKWEQAEKEKYKK